MRSWCIKAAAGGDVPIYEYGCASCGHHFEEIQKVSDEPIAICPKCEDGKVKRLISAPSFHLKGGGWYKDHYGLKPNASSSDSSSNSSDGD